MQENGVQNQVIFYGITSYLEKKMNEYISISGEPVIFVDKDEKLEKYCSRKLFNKYNVVSLDEALSLYPDAEIWVIYRNPNVTARMLAEKANPYKVHLIRKISIHTIGNTGYYFPLVFIRLHQLIFSRICHISHFHDCDRYGTPVDSAHRIGFPDIFFFSTCCCNHCIQNTGG